jgi:NADPH:quinone reductase-like Zn-dependent oxidoreductase
MAADATMKAIVLTQYGLPDDLELKKVEKPTPKEGEVLVKIQATSVNDWDWCLVRGTPFYIRLLCGWRKPNIPIPGAEVAGRVTAVGPNATRFQPGDAVYGDISECGFGGFAEYVCVPETALTLMPDGMTFTEAAAIPHAATLAVQFIQKTVRVVGLQPNKDLAYVNELFVAGQLKPAIDGPYPLGEVSRLIQYFGAGQHQGKVVISQEISPDSPISPYL